MISGIVLMNNGEWEKVEQPNGGTQYQAQDGAAAGGIILLVVGIPATIGGTVLGAIGASKVSRYQSLIESTALRLELGERRKGVRLSYSF